MAHALWSAEPIAVAELAAAPGRVFDVASTESDPDSGFSVSPELGVVLACVGGVVLSFAAFLTSYASKGVRDQWPGWNERRQNIFEVMSAGAIGTSGVFLFAALSSGHAIALMNAVCYSVQVIGNMGFQIVWDLSDYTKAMTAGTILFAITTIVLSTIAPAPKDIDPSDLLQPHAIAFQIVFWLSMVLAAYQVKMRQDRGFRDVGKMLSWSTLVTVFGVATDNWSRVMGQLQGNALYVAAGTLIIPGVCLLYTYVKAMSSCDVAIYVPTQLCMQLTTNVVAGYFLWGDGQDLDNILAYLLGYVIIVMAVYISTEELDIVAMVQMSRERTLAGLSKGVAKTKFGNAVLGLVQSWNQVRNPSQASKAEDLVSSAKDSLIQTLLTGLRSGALSPEDLAHLSAHLCTRATSTDAGAEAIMEWLEKTPYFQEYCAKDPAFRSALINDASTGGRSAAPGAIATSAELANITAAQHEAA